MQQRAENDPEHQGDKYLGGFQEQTKSTRSNVSKVSKSKVETGGTGSPQKRRKGLKIIEDEDQEGENTK